MHMAVLPAPLHGATLPAEMAIDVGYGVGVCMQMQSRRGIDQRAYQTLVVHVLALHRR